MAQDEEYLGSNLLGDEDDFMPNNNSASREDPIHSLPATRNSASSTQRLVIAIDYGTTYTGVAFAGVNSTRASLNDIQLVADWGAGMGEHHKIPSVYSYSPATSAGEHQWGSSISEDAVTMVHTKLELDVQENKVDELELILQVLNGTSNLAFDHVKKSLGYPEYTWKTPEDIVTDYLTRVFEQVDKVIAEFGEHLRSRMPVDIVLTVPVRWSYQAKNSTLRAVRKAGFNEETFPGLESIVMVTEPEAAAIFTARHLKEDKSMEFLKKGECFILCDAGGGTVDVVSYQVMQLEPLALKRITIPTSAKCGSAYINMNFKKWLWKLLGDKNYQQLDPRNASQQIGAHSTEGRHIRKVIADFETHKKAFDNTPNPVFMTLPKPLDSLNISGKVASGQITIPSNEMAKLFDPCVDKVVELIQGHMLQIEAKRRTVKNVFLVGGFGESPHLQQELDKSLRLRRVKLRRPKAPNAWTAVVKGAVICGIEKIHHDNLQTLKTSLRSYSIVLNEQYSRHRFNRNDMRADPVTNNIMAVKQLTWLVRKGDLLSSDPDDRQKPGKEFNFAFPERHSRIVSLPVYMYPHDDDDVPERFETAVGDLVKVGSIDCDLSCYPLDQFRRYRNEETDQYYYVANLVCKSMTNRNGFDIEIHWKHHVVGQITIENNPIELNDDAFVEFDPY